MLAKEPNVFPLVGGRNDHHLKENIQALNVKLTTEQIDYLESITPFDIGFPDNLIGENPRKTGKTGVLVGGAASMAWVKYPKPIGYE